jgi:hypothetical protein
MVILEMRPLQIKWIFLVDLAVHILRLPISRTTLNSLIKLLQKGFGLAYVLLR